MPAQLWLISLKDLIISLKDLMSCVACVYVDLVYVVMCQVGISLTHVYGLTEVYGPSSTCEWRQSWNEKPLADQAALKARQGVVRIYSFIYSFIYSLHRALLLLRVCLFVPWFICVCVRWCALANRQTLAHSCVCLLPRHIFLSSNITCFIPSALVRPALPIITCLFLSLSFSLFLLCIRPISVSHTRSTFLPPPHALSLSLSRPHVCVLVTTTSS